MSGEAGPSSGMSLRDRIMAGFEQFQVSQQGAQGSIQLWEEVEGEDCIAAPEEKKKPKKKKKKAPGAVAAGESDSASEDENGAGPSHPTFSAPPSLGLSLGPIADLVYLDAGGTTEEQGIAFRKFLAIDPVNLNVHTELRRRFGPDIRSSPPMTPETLPFPTVGRKPHTLFQPRVPALPNADLTMRELSAKEIDTVYHQRVQQWKDTEERWFTFEHGPEWRYTTGVFLKSHIIKQPKLLDEILELRPRHVETLLAMSERYRLKSDLATAARYVEAAIQALERAFVLAFDPSAGVCRFDYNRVQNRTLFLAIHRNISYLSQRGCWDTAFNFAKFLWSLFPMNDPFGAVFWLDSLCLRSSNYAWVLSAVEKHQNQTPLSLFKGYPGIAYSYVLACRAREDAQFSQDRTKSNQALRLAILSFPETIVPLADEIGIKIPAALRADPFCEARTSYRNTENSAVHLLSHLYISRAASLWMDETTISWVSDIISASIPDLNTPEAVELRKAAVFHFHGYPRDLDEVNHISLTICRHVFNSQPDSLRDFLPPNILGNISLTFDPCAPLTATSKYDTEYLEGKEKPTKESRSALAQQSSQNGQAMIEMIKKVKANNPSGWGKDIRQILTPMSQKPGTSAEEVRAQVEQVARMMEGSITG